MIHVQYNHNGLLAGTVLLTLCGCWIRPDVEGPVVAVVSVHLTPDVPKTHPTHI